MSPDLTVTLDPVSLPPSPDSALAVLAEPLRLWFHQRFDTPTPAQRLAWPLLVAGKNLLLSAPTGSGKTLAALVPVFQGLLTAGFQTGIRCLHVAPLKALGNDLRKDLRRHLHGLRAFLPDGQGHWRVGLRTGDTPSSARRRLQLDPPDILLTTPESLAVLLSQPVSLELFAGLRWVVVDEVHALAPSKRGADLALSLERLQDLAGGTLQRVGLSATCAPLQEAAQFLAGTGRPCALAAIADTRPLELTIEPLAERGFLAALVERLGTELATQQSTLIFAGTRGLAERLAWALRRRFPDWDTQVAVHHSALAAGRRRRVEHALKRGRLRAVVSSTSLELGLDVGTVDLVVLVHPPGEVVRLLQRVGRSGHEPTRPRRGLVLTAGAAELLEAAVTAAASRPAQCEPLRLPEYPLDVLCQQLLGMAAQRSWTAESAFALVRRAYPYRDLSRRDLDDCLHYLSGRHADGRDWLPARLHWQDDAFAIRDDRTARLLRRNLGTILAEEPCPVLLQRTPEATEEFPEEPRPVGEVDEAFGERLQPGDRFLLDGRCLEFQGRSGRALLVQEVMGRAAVPRWAGTRGSLSPELARRLHLLRLQAREALLHGPELLRDLLRRDYGLGDAATASLVAYFQRQECVSEIPDADTCLVEGIGSEADVAYYVHTPLHQAGNDALARVALRRLARDRGQSATTLVADLGFALLLPRPLHLTADDWRGLLALEEFDADLDAALADSVLLRERFRRVSLTGLMLLRQPLGQRRRVGGSDWAERRLFDQVRQADADFVLLRQAQRDVRSDGCDADAAQAFLRELAARVLHCRWLTQVSPFVEGWTQLAAGPVESVESPDEALRRLHAALTTPLESGHEPHEGRDP